MDQESAADRGHFVLYRADPEMAIGRLGNVIIANWRKRPFERSANSVGGALKAAYGRLKIPLVLINDVDPHLALPNAPERRSLRFNIGETSKQIVMAVDISDTAMSRVLEAIVNGLLLVTRSNFHLSFAMVPSVESARRWIEPHARTTQGALSWPVVERAIRSTRYR